MSRVQSNSRTPLLKTYRKCMNLLKNIFIRYKSSFYQHKGTDFLWKIQIFPYFFLHILRYCSTFAALFAIGKNPFCANRHIKSVYWRLFWRLEILQNFATQIKIAVNALWNMIILPQSVPCGLLCLVAFIFRRGRCLFILVAGSCRNL